MLPPHLAAVYGHGPTADDKRCGDRSDSVFLSLFLLFPVSPSLTALLVLIWKLMWICELELFLTVFFHFSEASQLTRGSDEHWS